MKHTDKPIIIEQTLNASIDKVWRAITERSQMICWFFDNIEAFEPSVGFETKFVVENEGRTFPHVWKVKEVEPNRKLTYNWKYEGYDGDSDLTFELTELENGTRLQLTHKVLESFPQDIPEFKRESCVQGWEYFIKERLKGYLEGDELNYSG